MFEAFLLYITNEKGKNLNLIYYEGERENPNPGKPISKILLL